MPELPGFVLEVLPLPAGADVRMVADDARAALPHVAAPGTVDVVVLDVFTGVAAPAHLTEASFYEEAAQLLSLDGVMGVNVADDAGTAVLEPLLGKGTARGAALIFLCAGAGLTRGARTGGEPLNSPH